jgi:hypothetical protein
MCFLLLLRGLLLLYLLLCVLVLLSCRQLSLHLLQPCPGCLSVLLQLLKLGSELILASTQSCHRLLCICHTVLQLNILLLLGGVLALQVCQLLLSCSQQLLCCGFGLQHLLVFVLSCGFSLQHLLECILCCCLAALQPAELLLSSQFRC